MVKICFKCNKKKKLNKFSKNKLGKYGIRSTCKVCFNKLQTLRRKVNPNYDIKYRKTNRKHLRIISARYRKSHPNYRINYYKRTRKQQIEKSKEWNKLHKDRVREIDRKRNKKRRSTPEGKLNHIISTGIHSCLGVNKNNVHWEKLVPWTIIELKQYLVSLFYNGMTWNSFKNGQVHIHHKKPIHTFKFKTAEDIGFKECWALNNLQPLWKEDHIKLHRRICELQRWNN